MCIDYRQLNANSIPDAYPLPRIHHILERLRNAKYISTMDPKRGYWQFPMPCAQTLSGDSVLVSTFRPELRGHRPAHAALSQKQPEVGLETGTAGCIRGAFSEKFVLQTDASDCGLGAVLTQQHQGAERVIAYVSRRLVKAEENYSATEKECLAIVWAIRKLRCYLEGYRFDVVTDHHDNPTGQIARWALELQQYQFDIHYRRGKQNVVADALTRQPLEVILQMAQEEGPNCKWITRLTKRILEAPDRFPDFTIEGSQVYCHLGHRPEEEDYVPWKQCVAFDHPPRVLAECRKAIARISQRGLLRLSLGSAYGAVTILFLSCGHMYSRSSSASLRRRAQDRTHRPDLVHRRRFGNGNLVSSAFLSRTFTGDQAWKHLARVRGQNLGPFRFLSADLVRRPGSGDVDSSRE
ncbi:hypothetical protein ACLKA7_007770 [Drosophila subpalustris]